MVMCCHVKTLSPSKLLLQWSRGKSLVIFTAENLICTLCVCFKIRAGERRE